MKMLTERGYSFMTSAGREVVRDVKEMLCYMAVDPDSQMKLPTESSEKTHESPNGFVEPSGQWRPDLQCRGRRLIRERSRTAERGGSSYVSTPIW